MLLAWHACEGLRGFPDYLAYFNEIIGGNDNGYKYLVDSNLDWGQNRTYAKSYAREHGILFQPEKLPATGQVMVCANELQGILNRSKYRMLREEYEPVGSARPNWLVFDLGRNRRFPEDTLVSVLSGPDWRVHAGETPGWSATEIDEHGWTMARPAELAERDGFDPEKVYPGTQARLLRCETPGVPCSFRGEFVLEGAAAQAVLHLATSEAFDLCVNGERVGSERARGAGHREEEYAVTRFLRRGKNVIAIRAVPRDRQTAPDIFVEMRVAKSPHP